MTAAIDVKAVRERFPALDKEQVYFDNAGGSQILQEVADTVSSYLLNTNVQLGASYPIGQLSTSSYSTAYHIASSYINAAPSEIVFGPSTTQLFRNLSQSLFSHIQPGDEIVLSTLDHEANLASWVHLATLRSATIKWWRPSSPSPNPHLLPSDLRPLLSPRTKLVACTHTSNILGSITDVPSLAALVHEQPHALLVVDAVAYAPHRQVDVQALGVDFYAFSWYKVYGPHVAMLYASERAQKAMTTLGHFFKGSETLEDKLGLAAGSYELVAGVRPVVEYLVGLGGGTVQDGGVDREALKRAWEAVAAWEEKLQGIVVGYLNGRPGVTIWGEPVADKGKRVPVISFTVEGWGSKDLVLKVQERSKGRLGFRWGSFYSNRLAKDVLGLEDVNDGVVRVSLVHYNSEEEVREWVKTLDEVLSSA
ncbi:Cystathionine beta-lyase [Sphaceloma murrayae]|uniref:Cystathionine beta-lyase n=1 Tax=Sphaceloma murrayae TaxID=2082308 RepID=A0A2K1R2U3_9PEZI|nr:Cystathionine beta-lyase [Sphaceloma murrayae]